MFRRLVALGVLPMCAALLFLGLTLWGRSAPVPSGAARYPIEADLFLLLAPSVLIYLLALPVIWRFARRASVSAVATFSFLTFLATVAGLVLTLGPLYRALNVNSPLLADRLFFWVFPFAPVVLAMVLCARVLRPVAERTVDSLVV